MTNVMGADIKRQAQYLWELARAPDGRPAARARMGSVYCLVWHVGGELPWRSQVESSQVETHRCEKSAKRSGGLRLREAWMGVTVKSLEDRQ